MLSICPPPPPSDVLVQIDSLNQCILQLETTIQFQEADIRNVARDCAELQAQLQAATASSGDKVQDLEQRLHAASTTSERLQEALHTKERQCAELEQSVSSHAEDLERHLRTHTQTREDMGQQNAALQSQGLALERERDALLEENADLQLRLQTVRTYLHNTASFSEVEVEDLKAQCVAEVEDLKAKGDELGALLEASARDRTTATEHIAALRQELAELTAERDQLRGSLEEATQEVTLVATQRAQDSEEAEHWLGTVAGHTDLLTAALTGHEGLLRDCLSELGVWCVRWRSDKDISIASQNTERSKKSAHSSTVSGRLRLMLAFFALLILFCSRNCCSVPLFYKTEVSGPVLFAIT